MNKLLAAVLCCRLERRESSAKPATNRRVSRDTSCCSPKPDTPIPQPTSDDSLSKKDDVLEEEPSINEADTIANTNDPSLQEPEPIVISTPMIDPPISASESPADAIADSSVVNSDETINDFFLDLAKLQDGQAFHPGTDYLLGPKDPELGEKKCLILDLDETLVHSSFKYLRNADFVIPVEIDNVTHHVYVIKRPGVDEFLQKVALWYEVVVFTASVLKYGHPLLDKLDTNHSVHHRLFRDSCYNYQGNYIKNLSQIGRPLHDLIIIDNSPASYTFHPQHSVPISSWFSDTHDNELLDLLPILQDLSEPLVQDVSLVLDIGL